MHRNALALGLIIMAAGATDAMAQSCRSYTFAGLIGLIDIRCADHMITTAHGEKQYASFVRGGRAEVSSCARPGAQTDDAQGDLGLMTASEMIHRLSGTTLSSPKTAETIAAQCRALAALLDELSPREPLYRNK